MLQKIADSDNLIKHKEIFQNSLIKKIYETAETFPK